MEIGTTAEERYRIASKPWLLRQDIEKLLGCSKSTACKQMTEIKRYIETSGKKPYQKCVSSKAFLEYFGWNLKEMLNLALMEKKLTKEVS